jgi:hypothetical protein
LRDTLSGLDPLAFVEHPCVEPLSDQPKDPAVADPVLDEAQQPFSAERVEERPDVGVQNPVDPALPDPERERVQRIVLAPPGSEPVAEAQERRLKDRRQEHHHRCLDDLVLQGRDAERPLSAIRLGDVPAAGWQRSVGACMNAGVEVDEVGLEALRVAIPGQLIDAWGCASREAEKPRP